MRRALLVSIALVGASLALPPQGRQPKSPEPEQDGMVSKLSGGHKFTTGVVWSREGFVLFSDTPAGKILRVSNEGTATFRDGLAGPQGLALDEEGSLYVCETRARRVVRIDRRGKMDVVAERWEGKRLNGPNDIVATKNGHLYFTDPAFASADLSRDLPYYGVYHVSPRGELTLVAKTAGRPNGVALSPDGRLLYVVDSDNRTVLAYDVAKNGLATNERVVISGIAGAPDGVRCDKSGNVYVAANEILVFSPDGKLLKSFPASEKPSALAWGDSAMSTLYVAARSSVYKVRLEAEEGH